MDSKDETEDIGTMADKIRITTPFGEWLRKTREAKGFTQEDLAKAANNVCTSAYISTLERGQDVGKKGKPGRPSEEIVESLAVALGASVLTARKLAGYDTTGLPDPALDVLNQIAEQAAEVVRSFLELPADRRREALNIMRVLNKENVQIVRPDELDKEDELRRIRGAQGASSED
jgi:transcriptional regulator with XRE-family HTH domain